VGALDYITKPFQMEEVIARVKVHLELRFLTLKVQEQAIALHLANKELQLIANLDGLTEVANRRKFDEQLEHEWKRLLREQKPLSLILCDIDYFKRYNDFYGHQAGDSCLIQVARAIRESVNRSTDLVARYGGEEFAVILPNTDLAGATHIAKVIQANIEKLKIDHLQSKVNSYVTLSLGISCQIPNLKSKSTSLVSIADQALYEAKNQGRNNFHLQLLTA
jgi:diguanylate cyclase (GGDEF)-like protein